MIPANSVYSLHCHILAECSFLLCECWHGDRFRPVCVAAGGTERGADRPVGLVRVGGAGLVAVQALSRVREAGAVPRHPQVRLLLLALRAGRPGHRRCRRRRHRPRPDFSRGEKTRTGAGKRRPAPGGRRPSAGRRPLLARRSHCGHAEAWVRAGASQGGETQRWW